MVEVHRTEWHQCTSSQLLPQQLQVQLQVQPRRRHEPRLEAACNCTNSLDRWLLSNNASVGHGLDIRLYHNNRMMNQAQLPSGKTHTATLEFQLAQRRHFLRPMEEFVAFQSSE